MHREMFVVRCLPGELPVANGSGLEEAKPYSLRPLLQSNGLHSSANATTNRHQEAKMSGHCHHARAAVQAAARSMMSIAVPAAVAVSVDAATASLRGCCASLLGNQGLVQHAMSFAQCC